MHYVIGSALIFIGLMWIFFGDKIDGHGITDSAWVDPVDMEHKATKVTMENAETVSSEIAGGKFDFTVRDTGVTTACFYPDSGGVFCFGHTDERAKFVPKGNSNGI